MAGLNLNLSFFLSVFLSLTRLFKPETENRFLLENSLRTQSAKSAPVPRIYKVRPSEPNRFRLFKELRPERNAILCFSFTSELKKEGKEGAF